MKRTFKVSNPKMRLGASASFMIDKNMSQGVTSKNPDDYENFIDMMMDEVKFRKMFMGTPHQKERYINWLEND